MSDLDGVSFTRRGNTLVPTDFVADEFLIRIPVGKEVLVSIRRPRSPKHHRWFFAMLRKVMNNSDKWGDEADLLDDLKIAVGHVQRRVNILTGEQVIMAKSINFASMPEDQFQAFRDRCLDVLAKSLGVDPLTLMEEVNATQEGVR